MAFETIAGATHYIAQLEAENYKLKYLREDDEDERVDLIVKMGQYADRIEELEAENKHLQGAFRYNTALARENERLHQELKRLWKVEANIMDLRRRMLAECEHHDVAHLHPAYFRVAHELSNISRGTY
ncbi:hypothetical protein ICV35_25000 [Rhodococcus ruber]|uniref:hypothetical protein n=1 Tax=Rhodococcus ruber TaxID=1830 RepID=UPI001782E84D|nr:hypothetical protein [Rhodococcus ruber]MBD8056908.1 hypothetical protein [Rhodococcus ruber]